MKEGSGICVIVGLYYLVEVVENIISTLCNAAFCCGRERRGWGGLEGVTKSVKKEMDGVMMNTPDLHTGFITVKDPAVTIKLLNTGKVS